ncbi:MAG: hypothetical protein F4Z72_12245 [Gemmatimonadales bacterium]|nr:hypothetical protein [Candidatus Palauibacter irciniicola]
MKSEPQPSPSRTSPTGSAASRENGASSASISPRAARSMWSSWSSSSVSWLAIDRIWLTWFLICVIWFAMIVARWIQLPKSNWAVAGLGAASASSGTRRAGMTMRWSMGESLSVNGGRWGSGRAHPQ